LLTFAGSLVESGVVLAGRTCQVDVARATDRRTTSHRTYD